jgi:hypothetical protein
MPRSIQTRSARLIVAALLTLTTTLLLVPQHRAEARPRSRISPRFCAIDWRDGDAAVRRLIRCAERRWSVPGGASKAVAVARCESGLEPDAHSSGNAGVYQHATRYWPGRAAAWGFRGWSVYNGRANVIVTLRMVHRAGWNPWSGCA